MRFVIVNGKEVASMTAKLLSEGGHEVVVIESDPERIESLSDEMDVSFLKGDGSNPTVLREAGPESTDLLYCLSDNDQVNIIASLVGRSLGYQRVVTSIANLEYESICEELGLEDTIIPSRTISRYLQDMALGVDILELRTVIKGNARFFVLNVGPQEAGTTIANLDLPEGTRAMFLYREEDFFFTEEDTDLQQGDEVVLLTHSENLPELRERWQPETSEEKD